MAPFAGTWVTDAVLRIITKGTHTKDSFLQLTSMAKGATGRCAICSKDSQDEANFFIRNKACSHVFHRHCFNHHIITEYKTWATESQHCPACGIIWYDLALTQMHAQLLGYGLLLMRTKDFGKGVSDLPVPIDHMYLLLGVEIAAYSTFLTNKHPVLATEDGKIMVEAMMEVARRMDSRPRRLEALLEVFPCRASTVIREWYPGRDIHWTLSEAAVCIAVDALMWYGTTCVPMDSCEVWTMAQAEVISCEMVHERSMLGSAKPSAFTKVDLRVEKTLALVQ